MRNWCSPSESLLRGRGVDLLFGRWREVSVCCDFY